jgi:hypothetical protein
MATLLASLPDPGVDAAAGGDSFRSAPLFSPPVLWLENPAIMVVRVMRVRRNALDHVPRMFELIFGEMSRRNVETCQVHFPFLLQ